MVIPTNEAKNQLIDLRRQSRFWKAQHGRALEREKACKGEISQLKKSLRDQYELNQKLIKANESKDARIAWLEQQLFGRKSETTQSSAPSSCDSKTASSTIGSSTTPSKSRQQSRRNRGKQRGAKGHGRKRRVDLPWEEIFINAPEGLLRCPFCGEYASDFLGTEDSEVIDWQIVLCRLIYRRKRYRRGCDCPNSSRIFSAPPVPKLISKGLFSCNFWTQLLLEKFLFQSPLYRIRNALSLEGLDVSGGTLTGGLKRISELIRPFYALIIERNRQANHWKMDETRWMVYAEVTGKKSYKHWLWVSISADTCVYLLEPTRSAIVLKNLLGDDAQGIISADRYSAYKALAEMIQIAFCWSHIRRDFVRIRDGYKSLKKWADRWIDRINCLFEVNAQRVKNPRTSKAFEKQDRLLRRHLNKIEQTIAKQLKAKTLHSAQKKALESLRNHWSGATLFVDHPHIPMDNNESERRLRNPVVGRKNYYGSGALWSGNLAAMMFTLFQTLLMHQINPRKFLLNYFEQCALNKGRAPDDINALLPWNLTPEKKHPLLLAGQPP